MKILIFLLVLSGCATAVMPPQVTGKWEFDRRLTYQALYDRNGGLKPVKAIDGDLYVGARYEYHFQQKYFDFDKYELVLIGYLDNGEHETKKVVSFAILEHTFDYIMVKYTDYSGEENKVKIYKTEGCYYIRNDDNFNEYYCQ